MEPKLLWTPSEEFIEQSNLKQYIYWLNKTYGFSFQDYDTLWKWSVDNQSEFWESNWKYFNIIHDGNYKEILSKDPMPFTKWFEGTQLNYAEHIFRNANDLSPAIIYGAENGESKYYSWKQLQIQTAAIQATLTQHKITSSDAVVAYLPCIPEATIAFLATNALGAIWSSCSPDFGTTAVIDRFAQINPKVLVAVDHYQYNGKRHDKAEVIKHLINALPTLECIILISDNEDYAIEDKRIILWQTCLLNTADKVRFSRVPFNHPIWVLYSSGTTGLPKAITHSHGGMLLEQLKYVTFHNNFKPGERCFWYTTTGWMMWNYIHGSLLTGSTLVLYNGSPGFPDLNVLWKFTEKEKINHFGTSAGFILANLKDNMKPGELFNLSSLISIGSTGSTLPPEGFDWIYKNVSDRVWLTSMSGGTDVCSAFVGGNPMWPVYAGEIQCRALGCNVEAWNEEGESILEGEGELVITKPIPSMPVFFWNDPDFKRYKESYFEMFPAAWRHGDWIKITSKGGVVIYGRSDATLNRGGIRIGTSEIYRAVDDIKAVKDSLIICVEKSGGQFWMPLFVVMQEGKALDGELIKDINTAIRTAYSPRHVPDEIIAVPDIPYTLSGKKTEMPVKKIFMGKDPETVINKGSLRNPESLEFFKTLFNSDQNK